MAARRIVSGAFTVSVGSVTEVLEDLYLERVRSDQRIVGFSMSGVEVLVMYR